jgi:uncharacterized protein (DUF305 family)
VGSLAHGARYELDWGTDERSYARHGDPENIQELREATSEEADERFLRLMIPHRRAALQMTKAILIRTEPGSRKPCLAVHKTSRRLSVAAAL